MRDKSSKNNKVSKFQTLKLHFYTLKNYSFRAIIFLISLNAVIKKINRTLMCY